MQSARLLQRYASCCLTTSVAGWCMWIRKVGHVAARTSERWRYLGTALGTPCHATPCHATPCHAMQHPTLAHHPPCNCTRTMHATQQASVHYGELGSGSTGHCGCARPKVVGLGRVLANHLERAKQHSNKHCSAQNTKTPPHDRRQRLLTSAGGTSTTRITEMPSFRCCTSRSSNCIPQCTGRLLMA